MMQEYMNWDMSGFPDVWIVSIPQLDIKLRYWQDIKGFDKLGFLGSIFMHFR